MTFLRFAILIFCLFLFANDVLAEELGAGSLAPNFCLKGLDNKSVRLDSYIGKKVLIHFWAPSCFVCPEEMQTISKMQKRFGNELGEVITIVSFDNSKKSLQKLSEMQTELPVVLDTDNSVAEIYGVNILPETFIVDEQGKFIEISDPELPSKKSFHFVGPRDWGSQAAIESLRSAGFIGAKGSVPSH